MTTHDDAARLLALHQPDFTTGPLTVGCTGCTGVEWTPAHQATVLARADLLAADPDPHEPMLVSGMRRHPGGDVFHALLLSNGETSKFGTSARGFLREFDEHTAHLRATTGSGR